MATIAGETAQRPDLAPWDAIAKRIEDWTVSAGIALRDVVVLVPFVQLLAPARRAFAHAGGWMPRIETTRTLAASLGPPTVRGAGELGWGAAHDTLLAMQTLAREPSMAEWQRRDPRGFAQIAARVVAAGEELMERAASIAPSERAQWWARGRELLRTSGPGGKERLLAELALEWAARSSAGATDRLFSLRPAGWVVVKAGGADGLADALLRHAAAPALRVDTDVDPARPFAGLAPADAPASHVCDGFEDEASAAAAQVLAHVERRETPVALIAQDRALVRRIRALLERHGVVLRDETGWKLATTRAGASIMALLVATRRDANADLWLDWLKSAPFAAARGAALESLEAAARKHQAADAGALFALELDASAGAMRAEAAAIVASLARPARRTLVDWLDALAGALDRAGSLARLRDDAAGRQALSALGLDPPLDASRRAQLRAELEPMTLAEFTRWVDELLEHETFRPPEPADAEGNLLPAEVVVTPLARAMLRPFAAAVLPGADDRRLGAAGAVDSLLPNAARRALGLPEPAVLREAELLAFAQLLRVPQLTLLRRRADGADPLVDSPFVERLQLALAEHGATLHAWIDPRNERAVRAAPVRRSAPSVPPGRLPATLSASSFEALRDCPYRFFAQSVLGLRSADELDEDVEKRDYGKWLHEVLHAFHLERAPGSAAATDITRLHAIGAAKRAAHALDAAAFLPFSASFEALVPRYVAWLHEREARGAVWERGEVDLRIRPELLGGVELHGRVDRIDRIDGGSGLELIDYKTGSSIQLKKDVADRYEDTQLAFYGALVGAESRVPLRACYLALDATKGLETHEHVDVATSADALLAGMAEDLRRLRAGAGMAPLGEGSACTYCEARGLCRRDHWTVQLASEPDDESAEPSGRHERDEPVR